MTDLKVMQWPGKFRPASPLSAGIRGGDILWLAGQVPTDPDTGEAVTAGGIEAQTEKVFDNLEKLLALEGCGLERVVRCTVFLTTQADFAGMNAVYRKRFKDPYPARSTSSSRRSPIRPTASKSTRSRLPARGAATHG